MKKTFNLKKHIRTAFYDDDRGYWNRQTRAWQNCWKAKCDKGVDPQEAWNGCLEEYQKSENKKSWAIDMASAQGAVKNPPDLKTPAAKKITKKQKDFLVFGQNEVISSFC